MCVRSLRGLLSWRPRDSIDAIWHYSLGRLGWRCIWTARRRLHIQQHKTSVLWSADSSRFLQKGFSIGCVTQKYTGEHSSQDPALSKASICLSNRNFLLDFCAPTRTHTYTKTSPHRSFTCISFPMLHHMNALNTYPRHLSYNNTPYASERNGEWLDLCSASFTFPLSWTD